MVGPHPGIAQHLFESGRLGAILSEEAKGRIEPGLDVDPRAFRPAKILRSGEQGRRLIGSDDKERLLEARIKAGQPGEIGRVLPVRIDHKSIETGSTPGTAEGNEALSVDGTIKFRPSLGNSEIRQDGVDKSVGRHTGPLPGKFVPIEAEMARESNRYPCRGVDNAPSLIAIRNHSQQKAAFMLDRRSFTALGIAALMGLSALPAFAQEKFKVVTTFTIIADIARNVTGDAATVESITQPGAEIHNYQPGPRDIVNAQDADLVLWNGMNLEQWFEQFFENVRDVPQVVLTEGIEPMGIAEGPYSGRPNPHAWMSPTNALIYVENIRKALVQYDPDNADTYTANAAAYSEQIKAIDAPLRARLEQIPEEQRWLVTSEGAFSYLARDYGMRELYLWPINADQQGTPQQVRKVIDAVRNNAIPVVFSESTISDKPAQQVAKETGAAYGGVLYVDSISEADGPVPSYLKLLEVTVDTIARGFGK